MSAETTGRPLRVLHVIPHFGGGGGAEISTREILLHTEGPALRNAMAVLQPGGTGIPVLRDAGIPVYEPDAAGTSHYAQIRHVRRAIADFHPDLVTTVVFDADFAGRLAAISAGLPVLTSLVNTTDPDAVMRDTRQKRWKLAAVRAVDIVLSRVATTTFHAITDAVADDASRRLHIARSRIAVVPRGRSLDRIGTRDRERGAALRRELGIAAEALVLLSVGREEPQKGQVYLLDALARLRRDRDVHLVIAGRPGRASVLLDAGSARLGVGAAVHRLGFRDDIGVLHGAADVFVFPSNYEGLGGSVLEAMALGTPIVATEIPALSEVLAGGSCGLLVPPADPGALASAVLTTVSDPAATSRRVEAAGHRFHSVYTIESCAAAMAELYQQTARLPPPRVARLMGARETRSRAHVGAA